MWYSGFIIFIVILFQTNQQCNWWCRNSL